MSNLTILNTSIRTFEQLYSLADLHRASGYQKKHQPSNFIRLDTTQGLINEIESEISHSSDMRTAIKVINGGKDKGTWVCTELVLAYATWVSPKFHLLVLRAFMQTHNIPTLSERKTTTDERTGLRQAVSALVSKKGMIYSDAYSLIHQRFNVEHINELTPEQVEMAVEYMHKIYLEGELIIGEPKPHLDKLHQHLSDYQELLGLLVKSYHFNSQAHELQERARGHYVSSLIGSNFGEHYFHNFNHPLRQHLDRVREYIQSSSERIMFVQGMLELLEEPKQIASF